MLDSSWSLLYQPLANSSSLRCHFKAASSRKPFLIADTPITFCTLLHYSLPHCIMVLSVVTADLPHPTLQHAHMHTETLRGRDWVLNKCLVNNWSLMIFEWYLMSYISPHFLLRSPLSFWPMLWGFVQHNTIFICLFRQNRTRFLKTNFG